MYKKEFGLGPWVDPGRDRERFAAEFSRKPSEGSGNQSRFRRADWNWNVWQIVKCQTVKVVSLAECSGHGKFSWSLQ